MGAHCYFTAFVGIHGRELWVTNGTESGNVPLIFTNATVQNPLGGTNELVVMNNALYFAAKFNNDGLELLKYDPGANSLNDLDKVYSFSIFPNPATYTLFIQPTGFQPQTITLFDINGRQLNTEPFAS